jgi:hypothetical protein
VNSRALVAMLKVYEAWAHSICAPVFWRDENFQLHNGTVTFVRSGNEIFGVTNAHVIDGLAAGTDEIGKRCQIGGAYFDPGRLIARHPSLDLATVELSGVFLSRAGSRFQPASISTWPPPVPLEGSPIMLGGFPATYRLEREDGSIDFEFAWFAGKVQSSNDQNVGIALDIANSISPLGGQRIPAHVALGGWSGGPVFRVVERGGIERLELAAAIYQYSESYEIALAHPLVDLRPDGGFKA